MDDHVPYTDEKIPYSTDHFLCQLNLIKDALKRNAFLEAIKHLGDTEEKIQNELDWCYRTDEVLPFFLDFLINLGDAIATTEKVIPSCRPKQISAIIRIIDQTVNTLPQIMAGKATWQEPDQHIDDFEIAHRKRIYGKL
jgi:hypothetical protein